jgi:hypothetical protein
MSHELRTPLNAVLGFARLMTIDPDAPLDAQNALRAARIEGAGKHLLALVNDVLDLSRVEAGELALTLQTVDIVPVSEDAISVIAQSARDAGVTLRSSVDGLESDWTDAGNAVHRPPAQARHKVIALADRVRLRQVLINLLSNAVKYTRRGGHVSFDIKPVGRICQFIISDTGIGMTEAQKAHLFEPFNRLGAERSSVEGTGIGLVLTRHLVELMKGTLDIESTHGRGTVATVTLLRPPGARDQADPLHATGIPENQSSDRLDVLYVEDNEVNVEIVRQVVNLRRGIRLRIARDGATAVSMVKQAPPQLLLVDMHLGDMTGIELAARLRKELPTLSMHMVMLSADALPEQIRMALDEGFEEYLTKPIDLDKLLQVMDACSQADAFSRTALSRMQATARH